MGKSILICFASLLLLHHKNDANVYIVYSSEELLEKDEELIKILKSIIPNSAKLKLKLANDRFSPKATDFILVDEIDEVYFNYPKWFHRTMDLPKVIGFTATPPSQVEMLEGKML